MCSPLRRRHRWASRSWDLCRIDIPGCRRYTISIEQPITTPRRALTMAAKSTTNTRQENWQGMNWIRQEKRYAIYERDSYTCQHCGRDLSLWVGRNAATIRIELDHVVPVSKGGSNAHWNLLTSCSDCNKKRGDADIETIHQTHEALTRIILQLAQPINVPAAKQMLAARKEVH